MTCPTAELILVEMCHDQLRPIHSNIVEVGTSKSKVADKQEDESSHLFHDKARPQTGIRNSEMDFEVCHLRCVYETWKWYVVKHDFVAKRCI